MTQPAKSPAKKGSGCVIFLAVLLIAGVLIYIAGRASGPPETVAFANGATLTSSDANHACRNLVRAQLQFANNANFLSTLRSGATLPAKRGNSWWQWLEVESPNAFGVTVRTRWYCELNGDTGLRTAELR